MSKYLGKMNRMNSNTVDSQPKVNGLKVKTLGHMDVKIIRSNPQFGDRKLLEICE